MTTATATRLPLPTFYDAGSASDWGYRPELGGLLDEAGRWRRLHDLRPSGSDKTRIHLLLIDVQKDFCFPQGTLYVGGRSGRGAIDDSDRIARFIYANLGLITDVTCTMDTHFPFQIFFPSFWLDRNDAPLGPHREITTDDIRKGEVKPNPNVAWWLCNG